LCNRIWVLMTLGGQMVGCFLGTRGGEELVVY
jgi:hypothetical protein